MPIARYETYLGKRYKDDFSEPFLGGQNQYKLFCQMVKTVDGSLTCAADQGIRPLYKEACTAYAHGEKAKEEAIAAFKEQVANTLEIE